MLVLSRKVGDQVVISDNIRLTVLEVSGNRVRIGFTAPCEVVIWRGELEDDGHGMEADRSRLRPSKDSTVEGGG